jgi:hypothetical protein
MGRWTFIEFIRFFQKGLNPFKIWGSFNFDFVPGIYNLQSFGILKLVQKAKWLLVSPAIDLQNLAKFGHQEGHQSEFQILGVWKSWKIWIRVRPTCQPRLPLNRSCRSPVRARDTARVDAAVTVRHLVEAEAKRLSLPRTRPHRSIPCCLCFASAECATPVSSSIRRFSLRFTTAAAPFYPPHPSSLRKSTGRSSKPPLCLYSARPDTLHRWEPRSPRRFPISDAGGYIPPHWSFSTGSKAREVVVCRNRPHRRWAHSRSWCPVTSWYPRRRVGAQRVCEEVLVLGVVSPVHLGRRATPRQARRLTRPVRVGAVRTRFARRPRQSVGPYQTGLSSRMGRLARPQWVGPLWRLIEQWSFPFFILIYFKPNSIQNRIWFKPNQFRFELWNLTKLHLRLFSKFKFWIKIVNSI